MSIKLNILIVEDELLIAEMLKETLFELDCNVLAIAKNYEQVFMNLKQYPSIDFIFLDINLTDQQTGLDIAKKLNQEYKIPFIFLTSYSDSQTIQKAAALEPQGYLIKPFTKSDLLITLELFKSKHCKQEHFYEFKDGVISMKIKHSEILWVQSENVYIEIKTINKHYVLRNSLQRFLDEINNQNFIKIHRSYIVNSQHIKSLTRNHIVVQNEKLPISRKYYDELLKKIT